MDCEFDEKKFRQYFHYGLVYEKNDILDAIIMKCAKYDNSQKMRREVDNLLEYEIERSESLYLQFKRFIELATDEKKGWYRKIGKKDASFDIGQRIQELQKDCMIDVVTYEPMRGIYVRDRGVPKGKKTGVQRYEDIPDWIKEELIPILKYLRRLENENLYQYNSLFMDTMYARDVNCNQGKEAEKIKALYTIFMEKVKPAKSDVEALLKEKISEQQQKSLEQNCADYWTITDLKQQAKTNLYHEKVQTCYENIRDLEKSRESK